MLRLIHVSDLHLGDPLNGSAHVPLLERVPGLQGHDPSALPELELLFEEAGLGSDAQLVVTGDVTAYGRAGQFELANDVLDGHMEIAGLSVGGIRTSAAGRLVVAGNHDHLRGGPIPGSTEAFPNCFTSFFPQHPSVSDLIPVGGWHLRLLRLDTTAAASVPAQLLARGRCTDQVAALSRQLDALPPPSTKEVRALLLHHPLSHPGLGRFGREALDDESKRDIFELVRRHRIVALLSGHTHNYDVQVRQFEHGEVLEAVCGTSAQRSAPTYMSWPKTPQPANTVVVHEVEGSEDALVWTARVHERTIDQFLPLSYPSHALATLTVLKP